ncbi:MAG: hypothetical protein AB7G37_17345 [Solirubrobacteraceae bacterium]
MTRSQRSGGTAERSRRRRLGAYLLLCAVVGLLFGGAIVRQHVTAITSAEEAEAFLRGGPEPRRNLRCTWRDAFARGGGVGHWYCTFEALSPDPDLRGRWHSTSCAVFKRPINDAVLECSADLEDSR